MEYKPFKGALISSAFVFIGAVLLFTIEHQVPEWDKFFMWIPLYISPLWGMAGLSWYSERRSDN